MTAPTRQLVHVLVASVLLAGCLGGGGGGDSGGNESFGPVEVKQDLGVFAFAAFDVTADRVPGENAAYEDATVRVAFTVVNDGDEASNEYVTVHVDGSLLLAERVSLAPGETVPYALNLTPAEARTVHVQARAGVARAEDSVTLDARAHFGDWIRGDHLHVRLNDVVLPNDGRAHVNLTVRNVQDRESITDARVSILCEDKDGNVSTRGNVWLDWPEPGNTTTLTVRVAECPRGAGLYGVHVPLEVWGGGLETFRWIT